MEAWLQSVKPTLCKFAAVFEEEELEGEADLRLMKLHDINSLLALLDEKGIKAASRNALEVALLQVSGAGSYGQLPRLPANPLATTAPLTVAPLTVAPATTNSVAPSASSSAHTAVRVTVGESKRVGPIVPSFGFSEGDITSFLMDPKDLMDSFGRLLIDEVPIHLRTLIKLLWQTRYNKPWVDGPECGDLIMFGPSTFDVNLGQGEVFPGSDSVIVKGRDLRVVPQGEGGCDDGLWPGSRLMLNDRVLWMKSKGTKGSLASTAVFSTRSTADTDISR